MNVYIIGSVTKSEETIKEAATKFKSLGHEVRYVTKESGVPLELLIRKCFNYIENWADIVVVVPKLLVGSEIMIGDGTKYEIEHAKSFRKPVLIYC